MHGGFENPALRNIFSYSDKVYASPESVVASITMLNIAGSGWTYPVLIGHEFQRDRLAAGFNAACARAHQFFAGGMIEVVENVGQQNEIVSLPRSVSKALPGRVLYRSTMPAVWAFSFATSNTLGQSAAVTCALGFCLAMVIPYIPWPAAMSSILHAFPCGIPVNCAMNAAPGHGDGRHGAREGHPHFVVRFLVVAMACRAAAFFHRFR